MPLTPNFSATESLANPNEITFTDTSTGTDNTITTRRIYVQLANGNWLTEDGESETVAYTSWDYSDTSITLDLLTESTAPLITVEWYAGATLTYTKSRTYCFNLYDYLFGLQLLQSQTSNPNTLQDTNYYSNFMEFIVNIFNQENAITYGDDIYSSQNAMNKNANFILNETKYF